MNEYLASRPVRITSATMAVFALTATLALLGACTQPMNCTETYRGGCVAGPPQPMSPPPAAVVEPMPAPVPPPPPVAAAPAVPYGDPASFAAIDDKQCRSYGLTFGTHDYADCRIRLSAQHRGLDPNAGAK